MWVFFFFLECSTEWKWSWIQMHVEKIQRRPQGCPEGWSISSKERG